MQSIHLKILALPPWFRSRALVGSHMFDAAQTGQAVHKPDEIAAKLPGLPHASLDQRAKKVARHIAGRTHMADRLITLVRP
jgi:hypothetical protein